MRLVTTLAFTLAMAPCVAQTGIDDDIDDALVVATTLDTVRESPDSFKNVAVRFSVQFCSIGQIANPFFTRFVPSHYANFYAWSSDQPIWRPESYEDLFGMLFLSKDSEQLQELYDLKLYRRLWITGVVRNVFQNAPWIEVLHFEPMEQQVNTATLAHLFRGERYMARREWTRAIAELSLAPANDVPTFVLAAIHRNMGICYLRLGESRQAVHHLDSAVSYMNRVDSETYELLRVAQENPEAGLDRTVDRDGIRESDRPMWEAFSEAGEAAPLR